MVEGLALAAALDARLQKEGRVPKLPAPERRRAAAGRSGRADAIASTGYPAMTITAPKTTAPDKSPPSHRHVATAPPPIRTVENQRNSLQRRLGNQRLHELLLAKQADASARRANAGRLQAKLTVNVPGDVHEQEADRIADAVMRMPGPHAQSGAVAETTAAPAQVQTRALPRSDSGGIAAPPIVDEVLSSPGQPLDTATRAFMEPRFGRDFSYVRVHKNAVAAEAARAMDARAFTVGGDIAFASEEYAPGTHKGRHLLAHELTHTLQHGSGEQPAAVQLQKDPNTVPESATGGAGIGLELEAIIRDLYLKADLAIYTEANYMLSKGVPPDIVAKWINKARNVAKEEVRKWSVLKRWAEERNKLKYGNKVGPSYEQLKAGDPSHNIKPKTDLEIIESAASPNKSVTKWAGRFRIAGRILIAIDLAVAAYHIASAPTEDRPKVFIKEATGLAGAAAGGWAGAEGGAWAGGVVGAWFGGAGAAPGAAIGAILGGIGGAIVGAWGGAKTGDWLVDQLYPVEETRFEEGR